jgi:hypothetical protein
MFDSLAVRERLVFLREVRKTLVKQPRNVCREINRGRCNSVHTTSLNVTSCTAHITTLSGTINLC